MSKDKEPLKLHKILNKILPFILVVITVYGTMLYYGGLERDRNLAYTAVFMDDIAVDLYREDASIDAIILASGIASRFCDIYKIEKRNLEYAKYYVLCDAIQERNKLLVGCVLDDTVDCPEWRIQELDRLLEQSADIAEDLHKNPPYYGFVLSYLDTPRNAYGDEIIVIPQEISQEEDIGITD